MKIFKLLLIILNIFICFTFLSCSTYEYKEIKEGVYSSSRSYYNKNYFKEEEYTQIKCEFRLININKYNQTKENVISQGKSTEKNYFSINIFYKFYDMDEYKQANIKSLNTKYDGIFMSSEGEIFLPHDNETNYTIVLTAFNEDSFQIIIKDTSENYIISEILYYETYKVEIGEYRYGSENNYSLQDNIYGLENSKLIINEISQNQFDYNIPNQLQCLFGEQYLEINLSIYCKKTKKYEDITISFEEMSSNNIKKTNQFYYCNGILKLSDDEILELSIELYLSVESGYKVIIYGDSLYLKYNFYEPINN